MFANFDILFSFSIKNMRFWPEEHPKLANKNFLRSPNMISERQTLVCKIFDVTHKKDVLSRHSIRDRTSLLIKNNCHATTTVALELNFWIY